MEYVIIIDNGGDSYVCNHNPSFDRYKLLENEVYEPNSNVAFFSEKGLINKCGYGTSGLRKNSAKFKTIEDAQRAISKFYLSGLKPRIVKYDDAPLDLYDNGWPLEKLLG